MVWTSKAQRHVRKIRWSVVLLLVAGGAWGYLHGRGTEVTVQRVALSDITQTVVTTGRVMPPAVIQVGSLVSSVVAEVLVREGDAVTPGQLLARLDDAAFRAQLMQAEASLAEAQAGRSGLRTLDAPAARQQLSQAQTRLKLEEQNAERSAGLAAKGVVTAENAEQSRVNLELAQSQLRAAELQLRAVSSGGSASARVAALMALGEAQLQRAKVDLARTEIRATEAATVLSRFVEPGDLVTAGARLFTLSASGTTRVVIEPDERSLAQLRVGLKAVVSTEAFPDDRFEATVSYIAPSVDARRGTIEVRLDVPAPPDYLRPDMTASTEIFVRELAQVLVLPTAAVRDLAKGPWVYLLDAGRAKRRPVELGVRGDVAVQVTSGLVVGEQVIVDAKAPLSEGARVRAAKDQSP